MGGGVVGIGIVGKRKLLAGKTISCFWRELHPEFAFHARSGRKLAVSLRGVCAIVIVAVGVVLGGAPAWAGGGVGRTAGVGQGGLGGVDGSLADASGKDGTGTTNQIGGGGGGVDLDTGNGAPGGGSIRTPGGPRGPNGATGATGRTVTSATILTGPESGQTGGAPASFPSGIQGGLGGGGVGVSATADVTVSGGAMVTGGAGLSTANLLARSGGAGGGGVGIFTNSNVTVDANGTVTGGAGGDGLFVQGGAGGGAAAILETGNGTIRNGGNLTGGRGGGGTSTTGAGDGGAGVQLRNGGTVINEAGATITGGNGGASSLASGDGGAGIKGFGINIINAGTITGGASGGAGAVSGNAIEFTGGSNTLEIWSGSNIVGKILAAGADDTFALGGTTDDAFDVSQFDAGNQYDGFEHFEKTGTGTWTLTGASTATTNWTIVGGTLLIGDDINSASVIGDITNQARLGGRGTIFGNVTNAGTVAPGNSIGTLTISGNYTGSGGTLEIESALGDDTSPTDRLVVSGNTAGATNVKVINVGGTGAQTLEGIKVVDVGGTSAGTFSLQGDYVFEGDQAVVAGAYAYRLYKNGVSTPTDGDWYLRSALIPPVTPPGTPGTPVPPSTPASPLYQPGIPIYEAYPQLLLALNSLPTLQQRVGNRQWSSDGAAIPGTAAEGVWLRTEGVHGRMGPDASTSATSYEYDLWKLQAGADGELYRNDKGGLIGGITAHYETLSGDIGSFYGDGDVDTNGYGVGATLTWYGNNGFYADAQGELTWFDSDLRSDLVGRLDDGNDGFGYGLSLEAGKRFDGFGAWAITPQAQLVYSSVDFDSFTDPFGARVSNDDSDSLNGRLGVALDRQESWEGADGKTVNAVFYGATNLYYDFLDGTSVDVAGAKFVNENEGIWAGITLGGTYSWNDERFSLYGEVAARSSLKDFGDSYAVSGTAGIRVKW